MTEGLGGDLRRWEEELHRPETRRNPDRMGALLHPAFEEFGRSGRRYTRDEAVLESSGSGHDAVVCADEFDVSMVSETVALITYRSFHVDAAGNQTHLTLRSTLWLKTSVGWQMRFHRGTPAESRPT